ncbi:MAG: nusB family protein [Alphaproteobacteria bacterium]|nr:nusB family protein [Alphaproteobacteria bacterium]
MTTDTALKQTKSPKAKAIAARLSAVQAVYQMHMNEQKAQSAIEEYLSLRAGMDVDGETFIEPNGALFQNIVEGVGEKHGDLQQTIISLLGTKEGRKKPVEPLLNAILLCGAYELLFNDKTDNPIIINDYIEISKGFYEGREKDMVNAILDKLSKTMT